MPLNFQVVSESGRQEFIYEVHGNFTSTQETRFKAGVVKLLYERVGTIEEYDGFMFDPEVPMCEVGICYDRGADVSTIFLTLTYTSRGIPILPSIVASCVKDAIVNVCKYDV